MPIQQMPSFWGNLGQGFQGMLQNAMMLFLMKKYMPEGAGQGMITESLGQTPIPPARTMGTAALPLAAPGAFPSQPYQPAGAMALGGGAGMGAVPGMGAGGMGLAGGARMGGLPGGGQTLTPEQIQMLLRMLQGGGLGGFGGAGGFRGF